MKILIKLEYNVRIVVRFVKLGVLFGPLIVSFPVWYIMEYKLSKSPTIRYWWVNWLVWTLEHSGPTFTKLGQWASSRVDLFPDDICKLLSKLQSHVHPHPMLATKLSIESAYGQKMTELFEDFNEEPVGVGAVAQVYQARLKDGRKVAVKVLHPYAHELVNIDLKIMHGVAKFIEFVIPESHWLSLPDEVEMFSFMMKQQLDLSLEGKHLNQFEKNFRKWSLVGFPVAVQAADPNVLIETWVEGIPMEKFLRLGPSKLDRRIAMIGLSSFLV
jgi:aarF domain-containing kinase